MVIDFEESGGRVSVQRETWETRSGTGMVVATRTQFPIIQFYGITCHKSQGLTLSKAVVHCSKEFVPGLMYVVLTRIRSSKDIRVLNFSSSQLIPPSQECLDVFKDQGGTLAECGADCSGRSRILP